MIYINKNQLSKWYRYAGIAIIVFVLGLMLCSIGAGCRMSCYNKMRMEGCGMERGMGMMHGQHCMSGGCDKMMPSCHKGGSSMQGCEMDKSNCCEMHEEEGCCAKQGKTSCEHEEWDEEDDDDAGMTKMDTVKKEVIINKK
ncbi:MAG: hypothetical protein IT235_06620 [Bacteroidia bacterium]|nr:hypothetical protein [Bacteroidia bacterium]